MVTHGWARDSGTMPALCRFLLYYFRLVVSFFPVRIQYLYQRPLLSNSPVACWTGASFCARDLKKHALNVKSTGTRIRQAIKSTSAVIHVPSGPIMATS